MAHTNSLAFPNMFSTSRNMVNVYADATSITNRCKLLMLSDPTSLYNSPTFGVGLKRYLFQYNSENTKAIIKDRICKQLSEFEPCVDVNGTTFSDGLLYTGGQDDIGDPTNINKLKMTIILKTIYEDKISLNLNELTGGEN